MTIDELYEEIEKRYGISKFKVDDKGIFLDKTPQGEIMCGRYPEEFDSGTPDGRKSLDEINGRFCRELIDWINGAYPGEFEIEWEPEADEGEPVLIYKMRDNIRESTMLRWKGIYEETFG